MSEQKMGDYWFRVLKASDRELKARAAKYHELARVLRGLNKCAHRMSAEVYDENVGKIRLALGRI
jgi:hypothetical protein